MRCASGHSPFKFQWTLVSVTLVGTEARASTGATSTPASASGATSVPTAKTVSLRLCSRHGLNTLQRRTHRGISLYTVTHVRFFLWWVAGWNRPYDIAMKSTVCLHLVCFTICFINLCTVVLQFSHAYVISNMFLDVTLHFCLGFRTKLV